MEATFGDPIQELCEEATCSLCLDYFSDPVTIECGHNFCQACLTQYWGKSEQEACCPHCRKSFQIRNLVPNRQLANFVEITKKLRHHGGKRAPAEEVQGRVCEKHREPLKLFCKEDEMAICVVCDKSHEHRNHEVIPVEETVLEYKNQICNYLEFLKKERLKMLAYKAEIEKESQDLLKQAKAEVEKTVANFRQLRQFLEEQEKLLLAQMEAVLKEIARETHEGLIKISKELSFLESLVREMEEKCQQAQDQLLQDGRSILLRLMYLIMTYALISGQKWQKANITLDPDTAHPQLILSQDHKSVKLGEKRQRLPERAQRFDGEYVVLGCEGFTSGRHFWEVAVGCEEEWAIGVAKKSVERKGSIEFNPKGGIWEMGKWGGKYRAPSPTPDIPLFLRKEPRRIRVSLNSAAGQVAFYDADTAGHLYTFSEAPFTGKTLLPFFWVRQKGYLTVSQKPIQNNFEKFCPVWDSLQGPQELAAADFVREKEKEKKKKKDKQEELKTMGLVAKEVSGVRGGRGMRGGGGGGRGGRGCGRGFRGGSSGERGGAEGHGCYQCGQIGHFKRECLWRAGGEGGFFSDNYIQDTWLGGPPHAQQFQQARGPMTGAGGTGSECSAGTTPNSFTSSPALLAPLEPAFPRETEAGISEENPASVKQKGKKGKKKEEANFCSEEESSAPEEPQWKPRRLDKNGCLIKPKLPQT